MSSRNHQDRVGDKYRRASSRPTRSVRSSRAMSKMAAQSYERNHREGSRDASFEALTGTERYAPGVYIGDEGEESTEETRLRDILSEQYSRSNPQYSVKNNKDNRSKKVLIAVASVLILALFGCGIALVLFTNNINDLLGGDKTDEEKAKLIGVLDPHSNDSADPFYVLLIGSDKRSNGEEIGQRSDTNILVRVDPSQGIITMISIPRDTMITIDGYGTEKFNAAYQYDGAAGTVKEAKKLCGVDIAYCFEIDFDKFIAMIDTLGGIEVDVPERIYDPDAGPYIIEAGPQTLDGGHALTFARSRAYADGDFTRVSNQRLVIEAIIEKVYKKNITEIPGIISSLASCITTNMKADQIAGLAVQMKRSGGLTVYSAMVPSYTAEINGGSYVITDKEALKEMMALVNAGKDPSGVVSTQTYNGYSGSGYAPSSYWPDYDDTDYQEPATAPTDPSSGGEGDLGGPSSGIDDGHGKEEL